MTDKFGVTHGPIPLVRSIPFNIPQDADMRDTERLDLLETLHVSSYFGNEPKIVVDPKTNQVVVGDTWREALDRALAERGSTE